MTLRDDGPTGGAEDLRIPRSTYAYDSHMRH